jgi:hypothetical protein
LYGSSDHPDIAQGWDKVGFVLRLMGRTDESLPAHSRAEAMLAASFGSEDPRVAMAVTNKGLALLELGDLPAAAEAQRWAHDIFVRWYGPSHPHSAMTAQRLQQVRDAAPRRRTG